MCVHVCIHDALLILKLGNRPPYNSTDAHIWQITFYETCVARRLLRIKGHFFFFFIVITRIYYYYILITTNVHVTVEITKNLHRSVIADVTDFADV